MNEEQKKQEEQEQELANVEEVVETTEGVEEVVGKTDGEPHEEPPVEEDPKQEDVQQPDDTAKEDEGEEPEADKDSEGEPDELKPEEEEQQQEPEKEEEEENKETKQEPSVDDLKKRIEEYEIEKQERETLDQYTKLVNDVYADVQRFETIVQNGMIEGLKKFGIDPNLTFEEIKQQDPAKYELAVELVNQAQQRIDQHRQQAKDVLDGEGSKIVFDKAEKEIKKYDLTPEQQVNAAEMFVNIMMRTGIQDLGEDLISKVKLAVGNAMIDVPRKKVEEATKEETLDVNPTSDTTNSKRSDTTVSKEPTVVEEPTDKDKVEKKPANTPVQKVNLDDYKEGATDTSARADAVVNKDAVTVDNVLQKLAALPYRERVAFMLEHEQEYNDAMSRRK